MTHTIEMSSEELRNFQAPFLKMIGGYPNQIKQIKFEPTFNRISIYHERNKNDFELDLFLGIVNEYFEQHEYELHHIDNHILLTKADINECDYPALDFAPTCLEEALDHDFFEMLIEGFEIPAQEVKKEIADKYHREIENIKAKEEKDKYCKWQLWTKSNQTKHVSIDEIIEDNSIGSKFVILSKEFLCNRSSLEIEQTKYLLNIENQIDKQAILLEYEAECIQESTAKDESYQWILLSLDGKRIDEIKSCHNSLEDLFKDVKKTEPWSIFKFISLSGQAREEFLIIVDGKGILIAKRLKPGEPVYNISEGYFFDLLKDRDDLPLEEGTPF